MKKEIGSIRNRNWICKVLCACLFWLAAVVPLKGQSSTASNASGLEQTANPEENFKIRVSVDEVRIDAVVLNWRGRQITDLTAEDFEIYQDGKKQEIISAVYLNEQASQPDSRAPLISAPAPSRDRIRKTILFLVDDLSMGFVNLHHTRMGLKNFVEKQMQPGDLVGILRTSLGSGPLFSSDKRQLLAAIEDIQWGTPQAIASCGPGG
jgi:VWFA-related protein